MNAHWAVCIAMNCPGGHEDLTQSVHKKRYATDGGARAQKAVLWLASFVADKPDKSVRLCNRCHMLAHSATLVARMREGTSTIEEEEQCVSMEYMLSRVLEHLPLATFVSLTEDLDCAMELRPSVGDAGKLLGLVVEHARRSAASSAHDDAPLMRLWRAFLVCTKKPGSRSGWVAAPELTSSLLALYVKRFGVSCPGR